MGRAGAWTSVALLLLIGLLWQGAVGMGFLDPAIWSKPTAILASGWVAIGSEGLLRDALLTFVSVAMGLAAGLAVGAPLGIAMGISQRLTWMFEVWLTIFNSLPRFALTPLLVVALGLGLASKVSVAFLSSVIPITLLVAVGVRQIPPDMHRVAMSFGLRPAQTLTKIVLPASVPHLLAGLQFGLSRALTAVIVAEMYNPVSGLGRWIAVGQVNLDPSQLFFAALLIAVVGALLAEGFGAIQRGVVRWR